MARPDLQPCVWAKKLAKDCQEPAQRTELLPAQSIQMGNCAVGWVRENYRAENYSSGPPRSPTWVDSSAFMGLCVAHKFQMSVLH